MAKKPVKKEPEKKKESKTEEDPVGTKNRRRPGRVK
jgi:hypothetical protein